MGASMEALVDRYGAEQLIKQIKTIEEKKKQQQEEKRKTELVVARRKAIIETVNYLNLLFDTGLKPQELADVARQSEEALEEYEKYIAEEGPLEDFFDFLIDMFEDEENFEPDEPEDDEELTIGGLEQFLQDLGLL